ncbi:MAG: M23 family metallopeptidase [Myxococcaceae bacterium]
MPALRPFALLLLPLSCAAPQAGKMSFEEAVGKGLAAPAPAGVRKAPSRTAGGARRRPEASTSLELQSALLGFGAQARSLRSGLPLGSAMPPGQADNWREVGSAVDAFLERSAAQTSSFDLIRARVTLEAELEQDARAYGDFPPGLAERVLEQVTRLAVRMSQVRLLGVKTRRSLSAFAWPVDPVVVTSVYGRRLHPLTRVYKVHSGIDLAADEGQLISAAAGGVVLFAGWSGAYGRQIELQHGDGAVTRYGHLSQLLVEPGLKVGRGDPIGLAGTTGASTGPHLHFELLRGGKPCDPLVELGHPLAPSPAAHAARPGAGIGGPP